MKRINKNILLGGLVVLVLVLGVAYAAFASNLVVTGTSNITNNWDIKITNIQSRDIEGATDKSKSFTDLSATFQAEFAKPGDSITYDITVTNNGSLDAELKDINKTMPESEYIEVEFSGFTKGEVLYQDTSKVITVKVSFKDVDIESLVDPVPANLSLDLTFTQQGNSSKEEPITKYKITYDCDTNGGVKCDDYNEYKEVDSDIALTYTATKDNYTFVGWNTDKDATSAITAEGLGKLGEEDITLYAIYKKDITLTYTKSNDITSIGKETDTCSMYNNAEACSVTLPSITISDTEEHDANWYLDNTKIGGPSTTYEVNANQTLNARQRLTPLLRNPIIDSEVSSVLAQIGSSITGYADFLNTYVVDINETPVPEDALYNWDASEKQNGSVTAWVVDARNANRKYNLYIGGDGGVIAPEDSTNLFYNLGNNSGGDRYVSLLDTSNVTNMSYMFAGTGGYSNNVNGVENFDTSKVTNMSGMFRSSGIIGNLSNFDTSNVTDMSYMFARYYFTMLDLSNFNTSNVTNMGGMFEDCNNLTTLDLSSFDTSNVTNMSYMFEDCHNLTTLDLSSFDTSNVSNMQAMFNTCLKLQTIYVSNRFVTTQITASYQMFNYCTSLVGGLGTAYYESGSEYAVIDTIDTPGYFTDKTRPKLSSFTTSAPNTYTINAVASLDSASVPAAKYEFSLDRQNWIESNNNTYQFTNLEEGTKYNVYVRVTAASGASNMYKSDILLSDIAIPTFTESRNGVGKNITITYPSECTDGTYTCSYKKDNGEDVTVSTSTEGATTDGNNNLLVPVNFTAAGTLVAKIPYGNKQVSSSYTVTMNSLLRGGGTSAIFNTNDNINSDVTKAKITTVEIKDTLSEISSIEEGYKWDVSAEGNGTVMAWVTPDNENSGKYHLYIGSTGNVVANPDSSNLFNGFTALVSANLSKLDTTNTTNMSYMFSECTVLTTLDLSNFDTSNVTNMAYMFYGCIALTTLDISSFNTKKVTSMSQMFSGGRVVGRKISYMSLETIYASDMFVTPRVSYAQMFASCQNTLIGGTGTIWSAGNSEADYAHIDKVDNPGYFTDKTKPKISDITLTPTTNSIAVSTTATDAFNTITKYEYSIDNKNYTEGTSTYTFTNLEEGKSYNVYVRVTNNNGGVNIAKKTVSTSSS